MNTRLGGLSAVTPQAAWLAAAAWTANPHPFWLLAAAACAMLGLRAWLREPGGARRPRTAALAWAALLALVPLGFWAHGEDRRLSRDFEGYWQEREAEVFTLLDEELSGLFDRGVAASHTVAEQAAAGNPPSHGALAQARRAAGLSALALYGPDGRLEVWDGTHRGRLPDEVRTGAEGYHYLERPLVSYLYLSEVAPDGRVAVAAVLMRADLSAGTGEPEDFASRVRARTGETLRISTAARAGEGEVFDLTWEGETLFSVSLERPAASVRRAEMLDRARLAFVAGLALAWLLLAIGASAGASAGGRPGRTHDLSLIAALGAGAFLIPVELLPGLRQIASPADLLVPVVGSGGGLDLARVVLLVAAAVIAAGWTRPQSWRTRAPAFVLAAFAVAGSFLVFGMHRSASAGFLSGASGPWTIYAGVVAGALGLLAWVALALTRSGGSRRAGFALALTSALGLAAIVTVAVTRAPGVQPWWVAAWALPLWLARPTGPREGRFGTSASWILALVLGATAALPQAWGGRLEARLEEAEQVISRLGTGVDPYLQFLLGRTAATVTSLDAEGATPVELLYRTWRDSGLSEEGYPVWFTLWSAGDLPQEELRIGFGSQDRPAVAGELLNEVREGDTIQVRRFEQADVHYLMLAPLAGGRVVSAVVPPLVGTAGPASLLGPLAREEAAWSPLPLTLIPLLPNEAPAPGDTIRWVRTRGAWLGEVALHYPGAAFHAHYEVGVPAPAVLLARAGLMLAGILAVFGVLWAGARALGAGAVRAGDLVGLTLTSFRARVTAALFAFFVLSNLVFGSLAYRTIAGASQRAARVLAERAVNDAAESYFDLQGEMRLLGRRVGADLVEYRDGELRDATVEEFVELGLYDGWVPFGVHQALAGRESLLEVRSGTLGAWDHVTAWRRLPDGDVLSAPVPLQAGAVAVQSRDVAHLLAFAVIAGAGLSLLLALLVGRTLARPIQTLKVASERVGGGNLNVRLEAGRPDEFGSVFDAFNRMVRRLRSARRELMRVNRRTRAVVEEVATGVVAFDRSGIVTLANPRARELLDLPLREGEPPAAGTGAGGEFARWVELYFRDRLDEASSEFQTGQRRIRARARRIGGASAVGDEPAGSPTARRARAPGGAVVSLEDVTDELRTERVLAWGEMARQVAHEVKNPLTPIKLSVQHIVRAWEDKRPDFQQILSRNAEATLREIDRLAAIASSFARFGAPESPGQGPLEAVQVGSVVSEVLALYGTDGPVTFESRVPDGIPAALARGHELKEVLVNLLENARAAVSDEGHVVVSVILEPDPDDPRVVLRVVDDGVGITASVLSRIFEPHFSTRSTGTGLGLAIVQRLVEGWGGAVTAESRPGVETVFSVRMRLATAHAREGGGLADRVSTT